MLKIINKIDYRIEMEEALASIEVLESSLSGDKVVTNCLTKEGGMYRYHNSLPEEGRVIAFYVQMIGRQRGFGNKFISSKGSDALVNILRDMNYRPEGFRTLFNKPELVEGEVVTVQQDGYWASPKVLRSEVPRDALGLEVFEEDFIRKEIVEANNRLFIVNNQNLGLNGTIGGLNYQSNIYLDIRLQGSGEYTIHNVSEHKWPPESKSHTLEVWEGEELDFIRDISPYASEVTKAEVSVFDYSK